MKMDPNAAWLSPQPLETASTLPATCYTAAEAVDRDRDLVFARSWQLLAHAEQLSGSGDHVVAEIAGVPLLLVRDERGALHALHNVCRHRAGPLATCNGRGTPVLTCKYHGWTYALDGRLRGAPEMGRAADFDVAALRLPRVAAAEWQGLVFCALGEVPPFEELVAGIDARLGAIRLADFVFERRVSYEIACDWKVYVDNFLEGYHLSHVHPGLSRVLDERGYRTRIADWHSLQSSPLDAAQATYGRPGAVNEALYYWLFPNTMLNVLPDRLQTNRVQPLGAGRCRVDFDYFYAPGVDPSAAERDREFADQVQAEDIGICEAVQRGLASGSYRSGRLNPARESGVWHFQECLRAAYRTAS
jgi:choline monooxygenase